MNSLAAGLLGGILIALATPPHWQVGVSCILAACALAAIVRGRCVLAVAVLAGGLLAREAAIRVLDARHDCGERRLVVARVDSIPVPQGSGWQYEAWVEPAAAPRHPPLRVRLAQSGAPAPRSGETWQLLLQFDPSSSNPSGDARRRALLRDHISATARVRPSPLNRMLEPAGASIDALRLGLADHIRTRVQDPAAAALLSALAVGVTGDVSDLQWRVFSATGITHLVAISGMHVTFFAMLCMAVARIAWRRWTWLGARCRRETFSAFAGIVLAFAYALLSGFSVPAQRTALMLTVFLAARCCGRHVAPTWSVAASMVAVLVMDPLAVLSAGFWLSFCAVASIIVLAGGRLHAQGALRGAGHVQWVVTVALQPVTVALFGSFPAVGPLANAAAIPLFTFALVPPVLVATALYLIPLDVAGWCAGQLVDLAAGFARAGWPWLVRMSALPAATWNAEATWGWLVLAVPAVACVVAPLHLAARAGALALLASCFFAGTARVATGSVEVVVFDVGASRSVLLRTARHQLLLGTGEGFGTGGRRFERWVLPELLRAGGHTAIQLDRSDRDSLQALAIASARLPIVASVGTTPAPPELPWCPAGRWQWDGVDFMRAAEPGGCWLVVRAGGRRLLVAPSRMRTAQVPDAGSPSLLVLPRGARDAGPVLAAAGPGDLALASVAAGEWESTGWRELRERRDGAGPTLWSTANLGTLRFVLHADGSLRSTSAGWRVGIWSSGAGVAACTASPSNRGP